VFCAIALPATAQVEIFADRSNPRVGFALEHLFLALDGSGYGVEGRDLADLGDASGAVPHRIVFAHTDDPVVDRIGGPSLAVETAGLEPEGFSLRVTGAPETAHRSYLVRARDDAGLMYGGLELAEQIRLYGLDQVSPTLQNPYMATRGTKFNIPLDARTPSYTDMSDVAQHNIATMWDIDFWKRYLDHLALHRYNLVSLWNLHPFPSMVRVPEYPDIALDHVVRSKADFQENYSTRVVDIAGPEILARVDTLLAISIDEKIEFWREVMRYGRDRNIDFYVMTWNIYIYGTEGRYGITDSFDNETTIDYFRSSVRAMFETYPDLLGIGITTGENFGHDTHAATFRQKEDWVFRTYGQGLLDAAAAQPDRKFVFVHRLHETGFQSDAAAYAATANVAAVDIAEWFQPLIDNPNIDFLFSFKYAQAHVYSSTVQNFHEDYVRDIEGMQTLWTLRNDDVYYFRWGAPDFVRDFYLNMPAGGVTQGFYYGSDQYVWGREFLARSPLTPRELELDKHWYQWMLWGRLGYDPNISSDRFVATIRDRFPGLDADALFLAWQDASMVYPITTGFHWGLYDFHWYIEGSRGRAGTGGSPTGFHDVERFITLGVHPGTGYTPIPEYVRQVSQGDEVSGTSPLVVADRLVEHSERALAVISGIEGGGDRELRATLTDIATIAHMGLHYGHKIRGATELALHRELGGTVHQDAAIRHLRLAALHWRLYAAKALSQYHNPLWTNRVGHVDWRRTMDEVLHDIAIAGGEPTTESIPPGRGGVILEAEEAQSHNGTVIRDEGTVGATGDGYLRLGDPEGVAFVEWGYDAPDEGLYLLELRYALRSGVIPVDLRVNGEPIDAFALWTTGSETTWAWDRVEGNLRQGQNTIRLSFAGIANIDHLRIDSVSRQ
jgi:hypothetical protein